MSTLKYWNFRLIFIGNVIVKTHQEHESKIEGWCAQKMPDIVFVIKVQQNTTLVPLSRFRWGYLNIKIVISFETMKCVTTWSYKLQKIVLKIFGSHEILFFTLLLNLLGNTYSPKSGSIYKENARRCPRSNTQKSISNCLEAYFFTMY